MKGVSFLISVVFPFPSGFPSFQADLTLIRSEMASEADFIPGGVFINQDWKFTPEAASLVLKESPFPCFFPLSKLQKKSTAQAMLFIG